MVLAHIAGDARTTARGETDRIARALDATGYSYRKLTDAWGYHPTDPIPNERELRYGRLVPSLTLRRPIPQEWA